MNIFYGVVENIADPTQMGRMQVRALGYHNPDTTILPTSALPWCTPLIPLTQSGVAGIGTSIAIVPGTWVLCTWTNSELQNAIILGAVPGCSTAQDMNSSESNQGFRDMSGEFPRVSDIDLPLEARAQYDKSNSYNTKLRYTKKGVPTAKPANVSTLDTSKPESYFSEKTWDMPSPEDYINVQYPDNSARCTKSGHVIELDDSPGYERISEFHRSGTYREVLASGDQINVITGKNYTIIASNDNVYIKGNVNLSVDGDVRTLVKGDYHLEVDGDYTETIKGSKKSKIQFNQQVEIGQDNSENITGAQISLIGEDHRHTVGGSVNTMISGTYDLTSTDKLTVMAMGNLNVVSIGAIQFSSPDTFNINSQYISLSTDYTGPNGITFVLSGQTGTSTGTIYTQGDFISDSTTALTGHIVSLNYHRHRHTGDGDLVTVPLTNDIP